MARTRARRRWKSRMRRGRKRGLWRKRKKKDKGAERKRKKLKVRRRKREMKSPDVNLQGFLGLTLGAATGPDLSKAQPVCQDLVHSVRLHLGPLQLEAKDPRTVLPQSSWGVVVELWSVGLS